MGTELSNIDVVLFALYRLGGISKKIHTEEIVWEAYQLAKERFSWRLKKFKERGYPDKMTVSFALGDAKKKKYGHLVSGRGGHDMGGGESEGWQLTPTGVEWIKKHENRIAKALEQEVPNLPPREVERFVKKVKADRAYKHFQTNGSLDELPPSAFTDMLDCTPDASKGIIKSLFNNIMATAKAVNDKEILMFLEACQKKFNYLMSEQS